MSTSALANLNSPIGGPQLFDVVVAGAGVVGLAMAIAFAREGLVVASVGPLASQQTGRTVALLQGSVRLLDALDVWPALVRQAAPLRTMRIVDDTPSLFRAPPVSFEARAIGLESFGYNVANDAVVAALTDVARRTTGLSRIDGLVSEYRHAGDHAVATLSDGSTMRGRLVVAADGAHSALRKASGIEVRLDTYPQVALTTIFRHSLPHDDISTEFHTPRGPFTLVPLPDGETGQHRSSLVWVMTPAEAERRAALHPAAFAAEIETRSRGLLGAIGLEGAIGRYPIRRSMAKRLVAPRLALIGEAAHAMPPIGAQGLNLSMRDVATLADDVGTTWRDGGDIGSPATLARYERSRIGDIALRGAGVHLLNESLLSTSLPIQALRGLGLRAMGAFRPLREAAMRQGLSPSDTVPPLMRERVATA